MSVNSLSLFDKIMADEREIFNQLTPDSQPIMDQETEDLVRDADGAIVLEPVPWDGSVISLGPSNVFCLTLNGKPNQIPYSAYTGYDDVTEFDPKLRHSCQLYMHYHDDMYMGMTWYLTGHISASTKIIAILGIRTSLENIILGRRGIAREIIGAIEQIGKSQGCSYFVIVWPLESMVPLLTRLGFTHSDDTRFTPVTSVMVHSSDHYWKAI